MLGTILHKPGDIRCEEIADPKILQPTDAIIRNLGERMRMSLGQPLIVEYVSGASGTVGTTRAHRAPPDGYTII